MQALFFLICALLTLQLFGRDTLLNFNMASPAVLGTIGNRMIFSSFVCVLAPFLIITPLNWIPLAISAFISSSSGAWLALAMGGATMLWLKVKRARIALVVLIFVIPILYAYKTGDIYQFTRAGRGPMWVDATKLMLKQPLGYGIGTFKVLYPIMADKKVKIQQPGREWNTAHNDFLQIPWEIGIPGTLLLCGWILSILRKLRDPIKLSGLAILTGTMTVHFPSRLCQTVLIILMYLAYCERTAA